MTSAGKAQSRYLLKILSLRRLRLAAELGDLRRFAGHRPLHALLAYAGGMDSRVRKSGQWSGKIKMSKRGSVALRTALYQAAEHGRLTRASPCPNLQPSQTSNEQTSRRGHQSCRTKTFHVRLRNDLSSQGTDEA